MAFEDFLSKLCQLRCLQKTKVDIFGTMDANCSVMGSELLEGQRRPHKRASETRLDLMLEFCEVGWFQHQLSDVYLRDG